MIVDLYIPSKSVNALKNFDAEGFYVDAEDYIQTLNKEDNDTRNTVYSSMYSDTVLLGSHILPTLDKRNYRFKGLNDGKGGDMLIYDKMACSLFSPNGAEPETSDSIVDKFVMQREFCMMARFKKPKDFSGGEFEEEMKEWFRETSNIVKYGKKMGSEWVEENIPRRNLRMVFINKANKPISCELVDCEIEEKVSHDCYVFYVKKIKIFK